MMKRAFRPVLSSLEDRLVLSTTVATPVMSVTAATTVLNHMFEGMLGRKADPAALSLGVPAMQSGTTSAQVVTLLASSPEYIGMHITAGASGVANETQYVTALYNSILGRGPDTGGLNSYVNAIQNRGWSLSQVASSIANSPEAATSPTSALVTDSFPAIATNTLNTLFQDTVGRNADPAALSLGIPAMAKGTTIAQMTTLIVSSPEFIDMHITAGASGVANETQYVTALYNTVLGRGPDTGGLNSYVNAIETGTMSLAQVAYSIVNSPEAATSSSSILARVTL